MSDSVLTEVDSILFIGHDGLPLQTLVDFDKGWYEKGEEKVASFSITLHDLTVTRTNGGRAAMVGDWVIKVCGQTAVVAVQ